MKNEKIIRKTLDLLIKNAESFEELKNIQFDIDDYINEGYFIKQQIINYNEKFKKIYDVK